ncbi:MAG: DNA methyltransferase [Candidatus Helarchaeota archaeon]
MIKQTIKGKKKTTIFDFMKEHNSIIKPNTKKVIEHKQDIMSKYIDYGSRGRYYIYNKLNELTGKEWIKFTKSWFILRPKRRNNFQAQHPAKFPEELVERYITFFTKKGDKVMDPMCGIGTVNYVCSLLGRQDFGIEIEEKYINICKKINPGANVIHGDCREVLRTAQIPTVDYIITSPPYWNSLENSSIRQKNREKLGLDTNYGNNPKNLGNITKYKEFVSELINIYKLVKEKLKYKGYLTIVVNNVYKNGEVYPLAFDLAIQLREIYKLKDEQIWCQDDKPLIPLGVNHAYVGNRSHIYLLHFRNE